MISSHGVNTKCDILYKLHNLDVLTIPVYDISGKDMEKCVTKHEKVNSDVLCRSF